MGASGFWTSHNPIYEVHFPRVMGLVQTCYTLLLVGELTSLGVRSTRMTSHLTGFSLLGAMRHFFQSPLITVLPGEEGGVICDWMREICKLPFQCVPMQKASFEHGRRTCFRKRKRDHTHHPSWWPSMSNCYSGRMWLPTPRCLLFISVKRGNRSLPVQLMHDSELWHFFVQ